MGRRSRHSAKTGDRALYKSRSAAQSDQHDDSDDDPMYDEVERHHRRKEEEYLKLDGSDDDEGESSDDDGITKGREGVFDLGVGGSSDESDESDDEDDAREEEGRKRSEGESALASSSSEGSDDSYSDDDEDDAKDELLNWGAKKHAYYHGDTADLEIGQDVADAHLEEEAGREVERRRLEGVAHADFLLDDDDDDDDEEEGEEEEAQAEEAPTKKKRGKGEKDEGAEAVRSTKRSKRMSTLSRREKIKLLEAAHPELLPLVRHFAGPAAELERTTLPAAGALLRHGAARGGTEAEAVGATTAGLRYLLAKSMLQASAALNLAQYLLLKADRASNDSLGAGVPPDDEAADDIRDHPVMARLDRLGRLADGLREGVEDATPGLAGQVESLAEAAALMEGGELSSSDDDEGDGADEGGGEEEGGTESSEVRDEEDDNLDKAPAGDESNEGASSSSESEEEDEEAARRRVRTEARFALRPQDVDRDRAARATKRTRRLAPAASDYGDEAEDATERAAEAGRRLAATTNSIAQKSSSSEKKRAAGDEAAAEDEYDDLRRGLQMMEEEFGKGSDDEDESGDDGGEEGIGDSDEDDFYKSIQSKSRAKKAAKQRLYEVRPKYPRLDAEVEGERAVGRTILKNRGLVAHKAKINRNPRVKKREQYRKALIRRRGAVREVRTGEGHAYGGEATGIKSGISRSRKLGR